MSMAPLLIKLKLQASLSYRGALKPAKGSWGYTGVLM
jgi:hypothetical protein